MRFYDREKELGILQTNWEQTTERGHMTVLIGRRRIGKTTPFRRICNPAAPNISIFNAKKLSSEPKYQHF